MARLIGKYRNNKPIPTEKEENKLRMIHEQEQCQWILMKMKCLKNGSG